MKCLRPALFILLLVALCIVLGTATTPAQQFSSGGASATISSGAATTTEGNRSMRTYLEFDTANPLHEADRNHTELTRRLQGQYQAATDSDERTKLRDEIEKAITEHFEIRQKIRAHELEELQTQIRGLQGLHDRREQEKSQIISDQVRQVLPDADGLVWGSSDSAGETSFGIPGATPGATTVRPSRSTTPANVPR